MPGSAAFVAELGGAALDLLDPQPGERILDVGCGEGTLTTKIMERGATVLGIDNSPEMIAAARAKGVDARADAMPTTCSFSPSSTRPSPTRRCIGCWTRSRRRARFSARSSPAAASPARWAARAISRGCARRSTKSWSSAATCRRSRRATGTPSPEEFAAVYEAAGFREIDARLIERPTPIDHGVDQWVTTFRSGWLDRAGVPEEERAEIAAAVADEFGSNVADYVRLRFIMRKPD